MRFPRASSQLSKAAPAATRPQALFVHFGHQRHQVETSSILTMHVPRRHSRRLLLAPGWVALGFLLLLGCQVILARRQQLPLHIIELGMPFLDKKEVAKYPLSTLSALEKLRLHSPLAALKPTMYWQHVRFTGNRQNDSLSRVDLTKIVAPIRADIGGAQGVQVRFGEGATYDTMIYVLDLVQQVSPRYYWFGKNGNVTTFYIVSDWAFIPDEHYKRPLTFI